MHTRRAVVALSIVLAALVCSRPAAAQPTYLGQWGSLGQGDGQFILPTGVDVGSDDVVYVVEEDGNRVQKFSTAGEYLGKWGTFGDAPGQLYFPRDIALGPGGEVYVSDRYPRIQKFSASGAYVTGWGGFGDGPGLFANEPAIAVGTDGTVYAVDSFNARVQRFSADGVLLDVWGDSGGPPGQLHTPMAIAVDDNGDVLVIDWFSTPRVVRYTSAGAYVSEWTGPWGLGSDLARSNDAWFYLDVQFSRVFQLDLAGNVVAEWGTLGTANGQFRNPNGIAVDASGSVFVADYGNHRIQKFGDASVPATPTTWGRVKGAYRD